MTRFTTFTDDELNTMESAFRFNDKGLIALADEIRAERRCREKSETEKYKALHDKMERLAMNANYGVVTKSCEDDEKLVVLCMINKTLKDVQETLEGMQETLERMQETLAMVDDKI